MKILGTGRPTVGRRPSPRLSTWVFVPLLILALAALLAVVASPVISWVLGEGTPGIFVARLLDCDKGCAWFGEFTSSDHKIVVQHVQLVALNGLPELKRGATVHVVYVHSLYGKAAYPGRATIHDMLAKSIWPFAVLALGLLLVFLRWIWTVPVRYVRWRLGGARDRPGSGGKRPIIPAP
jgi:hypothetical protein